MIYKSTLGLAFALYACAPAYAEPVTEIYGPLASRATGHDLKPSVLKSRWTLKPPPSLDLRLKPLENRFENQDDSSFEIADGVRGRVKPLQIRVTVPFG